MASRFNETRANAERGSNRVLNLIYSRFKQRLSNEFKRAYKEALNQYDKTGKVNDSIYTEHRQNIRLILSDTIFRSMRSGSDRLLTTFKNAGWITAKQAAEISKNKAVEFGIKADAEADVESRFIAETTKKQIDAIISRAIEEKGFLGDKIRSLLADAESRSISRTIIVGFTNIHGALNFGSRDSAGSAKNDEYNYFKIWVTEKDEKVRGPQNNSKFDHENMEGSEVLETQKFIVSGEAMDGPGDRSASIGNWINCRCFLRYRRTKK